MLLIFAGWRVSIHIASCAGGIVQDEVVPFPNSTIRKMCSNDSLQPLKWSPNIIVSNFVPKKSKMEELFHYMKTLRSQMNDVADQEAKISVEEHMHGTTIQTLQNDLDIVKNETSQVKEETVQMAKAKQLICLQISENHLKVASLEFDTSTLNQTMELMKQQKLSLSAKLVDRSGHYTKVAEDISRELKGWQEWIDAHQFDPVTKEGLVVNEKANGDGTEEILDLNAAKANLDKLEQLRANLLVENAKLRESVDLLKSKMNCFKQELVKMDEKSLEEELRALLSDKAGEYEYVQSLQFQIRKLKEISHKVRCSCGEDFNVELDPCA
ncbi:uncharacterized protein [Primulina huaijiensis]|uniref:uncharacterized protein isoform X3 n=1 Tax=Primulina huaijiensis TaxID=1492673 RepID=UPI003CC6F98F